MYLFIHSILMKTITNTVNISNLRLYYKILTIWRLSNHVVIFLRLLVQVCFSWSSSAVLIRCDTHQVSRSSSVVLIKCDTHPSSAVLSDVVLMMMMMMMIVLINQIKSWLGGHGDFLCFTNFWFTVFYFNNRSSKWNLRRIKCTCINFVWNQLIFYFAHKLMK